MAGQADPDPFEHVAILGQGAFGWVDKVRRRSKPAEIYARKSLRLRIGASVGTLNNEVKIMQRLSHRHIVQVVQAYSSGAMFVLIISPVADTDLASYLMRIDLEHNEVLSHRLRQSMLRWPSCLVSTLDYIHEMRVKHKDLKPANILIKGDDILIADFGIAMDMVDDTTTQMHGLPESHTPVYCAPEVLRGGQKTSRAADVFSLGCIFLEICTCLVGKPGDLHALQDFRHSRTGSNCYGDAPLAILQWIWYLWVIWDLQISQNSPLVAHGISIADLSFFMLDPNPKMRITCRQLTSVIDYWYYSGSIKHYACDSCKGGFSRAQHLPLHSTFKETHQLKFAKDTQDAWMNGPASSWEEAKRKWLSQHMWW